MRVVMRLSISGTRNGETWPQRGSEVDLPDDEAESLIAQGMAEAAAERATIEPPAERSVARREPVKRKRKA